MELLEYTSGGRKVVLCILVFMALSLALHGQYYESLTIENGLSQGFVSSIMQDQQGFIWIATTDGLNRYDGVRFKIFRHNPTEKYSLPDNRVKYLFEDSNGLIWVLTEDGIACYDSQRERFISFDFYRELCQSERLRISKMVELRRGEYCLHTIDTVYIVAFDQSGPLRPDNINRFKYRKYGFPETAGEIRTVLSTGDTTWVCTESGIWHDGGAEGIYKMVLQAEKNWTFNGIWINPEDGKLLAIAQDRLYYRVGDRWESTDLSGIGRGHIRKGMFDGKHIYFFGLNQIYEWKGNQLVLLPYELPQLISGCIDREGIIWLGTNTHGVRKVYPGRNKFTTFIRPEGVGGGILEDTEGRLWVQGGKGYLWLNERQEKFESSPVLSNQTIFFTLRNGKDGLYWGHRNDNQISVFSLSKGRQQCFVLPDADTRITGGIFNWSLPYYLLLDESNGLIRFYPEDQKTELFSLRQLFEASTTISLNHLFVDGKGRIWIGSINGLLCAELTDDGRGYTYRVWGNNKDEEHFLSDKQVNFIQGDPDDPDVIWVGTQHGLNRLDMKTGNIRQFKQTDGWPNDVICGILKGTGPQLWISTYYGLIELNTRSFQWRHFTTTHGLPANEFNRGAALRQKNGRLVFGGVNGLICFYPEDILQSDFRPQLLFTGLLVNNMPVKPNDGSGILNEDVSVASSISLGYDQSNLTFQFALLDFMNTSWNRYYYKLESVDETWQYNGSETRIQYVNLTPGSYRFWVKARNSDGYWSGPIGINITIRPPWWQTIWAYSFFAAGILLLIWFGLRVWVKQIRLRDRLAVQQMEADRLKELDNFRSELYANITHEFRTPLTMIIGLADQLDKRLEGELKGKTTLLARSGQQLLRLVNQILDLSRIEQRHLQLNLVQQDIVGFICYLGEAYASLAQQKGIGFRINSRMNELVMDFDPQRLQDIMDNLISNAFKFTPRGGQVSILLERAEEPERLHLIVEDNGIGIDPEHLEHIFERYYQANRNSLQSQGGSGIGLAYARALVEMMNGKLSVRSTPGEGSAFSVDLPIHRQAPSSQTIAPSTTDLSIRPETREQEAREQLPLVLVVEDNEDVAAFIASCLSGYYQVRVAGNGVLGEELAFATIPDVVISDISMPDRNGLEFCSNLKKDRRTSHIPVILLTARTEIEQRIEGLEHGANVYLTKPFYPKELLLHVQNLLQWRADMQQQWASMDKIAGGGILGPDLSPSNILDTDFIAQMSHLIEKNYTNPEFAVSDICKGMGLSNAQLHRKVSALTGKSPGYFLRRKRLVSARDFLLRAKHLSIAEIAYQVGYSDPSYFARVFSAEYGYSPAKYREESSAETPK